MSQFCMIWGLPFLENTHMILWKHGNKTALPGSSPYIGYIMDILYSRVLECFLSWCAKTNTPPGLKFVWWLYSYTNIMRNFPVVMGLWPHFARKLIGQLLGGMHISNIAYYFCRAWNNLLAASSCSSPGTCCSAVEGSGTPRRCFFTTLPGVVCDCLPWDILASCSTRSCRGPLKETEQDPFRNCF